MEDRAGQGSYRKVCKDEVCKLWGVGGNQGYWEVEKVEGTIH